MRLAFASKRRECTVFKRGLRLNPIQIPSAVISPGKHYTACKANATDRGADRECCAWPSVDHNGAGGAMDPHNLQRFIDAQDGVYAQARTI
jgi:hypothetical protein